MSDLKEYIIKSESKSGCFATCKNNIYKGEFGHIMTFTEAVILMSRLSECFPSMNYDIYRIEKVI